MPCSGSYGVLEYALSVMLADSREWAVRHVMSFHRYVTITICTIITTIEMVWRVWGRERCAQGSGGETGGKETTGETQT